MNNNKIITDKIINPISAIFKYSVTTNKHIYVKIIYCESQVIFNF
jgi:hypothetical protein